MIINVQRGLLVLQLFWVQPCECAERIFGIFGSVIRVPQNRLMPSTSSSFIKGFTSLSMYRFSSFHTISIGFRSGLSGGVCHQLTPCSSKKPGTLNRPAHCYCVALALHIRCVFVALALRVRCACVALALCMHCACVTRALRMRCACVTHALRLRYACVAHALRC